MRSSGRSSPQALGPERRGLCLPDTSTSPGRGRAASGQTIEQIENQAITAMLQRTHGNIKEAASILGVDRSTLYERIKKYNLPRYGTN